MGLRDSPNRRKNADGVTDIFAIRKRIRSTKKIYRRKSSEGIYQTLKITNKISDLIRTEEEWKTENVR